MEIERIQIITSDIRGEERRDLKRKCDDEGFKGIYTRIEIYILLKYVSLLFLKRYFVINLHFVIVSI